MLSTYTAKDLFNSLLPLCLFPLVLVFPGYITGWFTNTFNFKRRQLIIQIGIGLILSFSVSPIYLFLVSKLLGPKIAFPSLWFFAIFAFFIFFKQKTESF